MSSESRFRYLQGNGTSSESPAAPTTIKASQDQPFSLESLYKAYGLEYSPEDSPGEDISQGSNRFALPPGSSAERSDREEGRIVKLFVETRQERRVNKSKQSKTRSRGLHGFSSRR